MLGHHGTELLGVQSSADSPDAKLEQSFQQPEAQVLLMSLCYREVAGQQYPFLQGE